MAFNYTLIPTIKYKTKPVYYRVPTNTEMHKGPINKDYKAIYYYKNCEDSYTKLGNFCGIETKYTTTYNQDFIITVYKFMNESKTINEYEYLDNIYCIGVPDKEYDMYPMIQIEDMVWNGEHPMFY